MRYMGCNLPGNGCLPGTLRYMQIFYIELNGSVYAHEYCLYNVICKTHACFSFQSWFDFDTSGDDFAKERIIAQEREQNVLKTLHQVCNIKKSR